MIGTMYIFAIHPCFNILKNVIVGTIYRPPDENVTDFLDSLRKLLSTTTGENKIFYAVGGFNLDLLLYEQLTCHHRRICRAYVFSPALPHDHKAYPYMI